MNPLVMANPEKNQGVVKVVVVSEGIGLRTGTGSGLSSVNFVGFGRS